MKHHALPYRGIARVRAEASDANAILAELQTAVTAMRSEHEAELKALRKDVVQTEKVDRINADITRLTRSLDEVNAMIAALKIGGSGTGAADPDRAAHATAFNRWFRKGIDAGLSELEVKAKLTTQSDPDGGYLVPEEASATIDRVVALISVMRNLATVMPIGTDTYKKLVNVAGTGAGWVGEEEARPETSTATLRELLFTVMEIYANPATTQRMLDDGIVDVASWLADEVQITFAELEGTAFISGNGVKRPRGILSYPTVANASYAWGSLGFTVTGAAAGFAASNPADALIDTFFSLRPGYRNAASWLMSDVVMATVRKFKDGQGNYLWTPPSTVAEVATVLGKPVYTDENMPSLAANAFPVAFGDFRRAYTIFDRLGIRVLRDPYSNKPNVNFYTTKRVGGGVTNFEALKLLRCST